MRTVKYRSPRTFSLNVSVCAKIIWLILQDSFWKSWYFLHQISFVIVHYCKTDYCIYSWKCNALHNNVWCINIINYLFKTLGTCYSWGVEKLEKLFFVQNVIHHWFNLYKARSYVFIPWQKKKRFSFLLFCALCQCRWVVIANIKHERLCCHQ